MLDFSFKALISFVILLVFVCPAVLLTGCTSGAGEDTVSSEAVTSFSESETEDDATVVVADGGSNRVSVIISANAGEMTVDSAKKIYDSLVSFSGVEAELNNAPESSYQTGEGGADTFSAVILVEEAGQPVTGGNSTSLGDRDWTISSEGKTLSISGGNEWALKDACDSFIAGLSKKDGVGIVYRGENNGTNDSSYLVIATNQKNSRVEIYDIMNCSSTAEAVWRASYSDPPADARARVYNGKTVIMAAFGGYSASMVDYDTKRTIWKTESAAFNPHACELIPSGDGYVIGVASSTGGEIRFFEIDSPRRYKSVKLADAHGLLYDPSIDAVWAVGGNTLCAYKVELVQSGILVSEIPEYSAVIPSNTAHELQAVEGDGDSLIISTVSTVYIYSKSQKTFSSGTGRSKLPDSAIKNEIKGMGLFPDGSVVIAIPDGAYQSWTTGSLIFIAEGKYYMTFKVFGGAFYKARAFCSSYF